MKRLFFIVTMIFTAAALWSMPPVNGSAVHDGSLHYEIEDSDFLLKAPPRDSNSKFPLTGSPMVLVVLVDFPDYEFNDEGHGCKSDAEIHDAAYYKNLLGAETGLTMTTFYKDMSNGNLNLRFKITGPYRASGSYSNYGGNDKWGDDKDVRALAEEILCVNRSAIETAIGGADVTGGNVIFIHAGPGEENGGEDPDVIWSCHASLSSDITIKGKKYDQFFIGPEYIIDRDETEARVGVFCHEFGHVLGLKDCYDTGGKTAGVGNWSVMGSGSWGSDKSGRDPAPLMNWEKAALGWISEEVIDVSSTPQQVNFKNANDAEKLLRINLDADKNQYLVFEGKKKASVTDNFVPEDGLLITQIHEGVYKNRMNSNTINYGVSAVHAVSIVEAKSDNYAKTGLGDLWRGSGNEYRTTRTACFRSNTATSVGPMVNGKPVAARHPLIIVLFKTMFTSAAIVGVISAVWRGRKKLCFLLAGAVTMIFLCLACDAGGGGISGPSTNDSGPNTNYYENTSNVHSKTGLSGIRIYDIECNSDGSGSFMVVREN